MHNNTTNASQMPAALAPQLAPNTPNAAPIEAPEVAPSFISNMVSPQDALDLSPETVAVAKALTLAGRVAVAADLGNLCDWTINLFDLLRAREAFALLREALPAVERAFEDGVLEHVAETQDELAQIAASAPQLD